MPGFDRRFIGILCFSSVVTLSWPRAGRADVTTTLQPTEFGYYQPDGHGGVITSEFGFNYFVGALGGNADPEHRNFFVFDLSQVTGPVTVAKLQLFNPQSNMSSSDPELTYTLFDVTTPISARAARDRNRAEDMNKIID